MNLKRRRFKRRVAGTALGACWQASTPGKNSNWLEVPFLVCDAEMSSLDVHKGELLSLGWVCVDRGAVFLQSGRHYLLRAKESVGQSAAIHQLRDCELSEGLSEQEVLEKLLLAAAGRILVFHNAALDLAYLNRAAARYYGSPLHLPTVDTLALEHARLTRRDQVIKPTDLRLQGCRDRYNLPVYPGHNALVDALATAELLIAQAKHRSVNQRMNLGSFF